MIARIIWTIGTLVVALTAALYVVGTRVRLPHRRAREERQPAALFEEIPACKGGGRADDWKKGRDRKKGIGVLLSISTPGSVDEIAKRAKNAGIAVGVRSFRRRATVRVNLPANALEAS